MEFFLVAIIFIICMIGIALLIYYCQEYRNSKYSFSHRQKDIFTIALEIGLPGATDYTNKSTLTVKKIHEKEEDGSDTDSSTSAKIYFPPNTAAYSVAKRKSLTSNNPLLVKGRKYPTLRDVAAYVIAKKINDTMGNERDVTLNENDSKHLEKLKERYRRSTSPHSTNSTSSSSGGMDRLSYEKEKNNVNVENTGCNKFPPYEGCSKNYGDISVKNGNVITVPCSSNHSVDSSLRSYLPTVLDALEEEESSF